MSPRTTAELPPAAAGADAAQTDQSVAANTECAHAVSVLAQHLADQSRASMLTALVGGISLPPGELARRAHISASTASHHLTHLRQAGLLTIDVTAGHRYYRLATPAVAALIERVCRFAPSRQASSLGSSNSRDKLQLARTCYDHLAGRLGVALTDELLRVGHLRRVARDFQLLPDGADFLRSRGIDVADGSRRRYAFPCVDWTERRPHLAGQLGATLLRRWESEGLLHRESRTRAVRVTDDGVNELAAWGIAWPPP